MKTIATAAVLAVLAGPAAYAQQPATPPSARPLTTLPADSGTVANYYKQNVYDPSDNKIGEIADVLIDQEGRVNAFIVSVGGFLGAGEKDVAVPFNAVKGKKKDNKWYLVMNATKEALKDAPGYKYDSNKTQWMPEKS
jgi:sporulation protein YlmC with PRC-barrel domain